MNYNLLTNYSENIDYNNILKEYPRPQFKRNSYFNLNGIWNYKITKNEEIPISFIDEVVVPFPIESILSKVRKELNKDETLFYYKEFEIKKDFLKEICILHFESVDQICEVYLNNKYIGKNEGGYLPFYFDISNFINIGKNILIVKVKDELNVDYPYGKQCKKRGGMWYTPVSGIWGSVWLESVNKNYIKNIKITPDLDNTLLKLEIDSESDDIEITVKEKNNIIYKKNVKDKYIEIPIDNPKIWSPENPFLYNLYLKSSDDEVESYFAMRKFSIDKNFFYLNNKPYFINGVLDQGYFSDGIYTPSSYQVYKDDILTMKSLGFNTLRKHIKIEPKMFYYYCDLYGMIVIQDMVNVGKYSFFKHTLLPNIGLKKMMWKNVNDIQKENFIKNTKKTIEYLYNYPSIAYYTIFNEAWGQFDSDELYNIVKSLDNTRVIDTASGWFKNELSDVTSLHIYFKKIKLKKSNKPIIVSEFGGYSYKIKNHCFNPKRTFGYRLYKNQSKFEKGLIKLYENQVLNNIKNNLAGTVYTQLSDVEDETNGLLTYDRKICKVNKELVSKIMKKINDEFNRRINI